MIIVRLGVVSFPPQFLSKIAAIFLAGSLGASAFADGEACAKARLLIDATVSMQGFTAAKKNTVYAAALEAAERVSQQLPSVNSVDYFVFGGTEGHPATGPIGRAEFLTAAATRPEFYNNKSKGFWQKTYLPEAIAGINHDEFAVFVTDLFTEQSDVAQLSAELRRQAAADRTIALLGLQSDFHGKVFDVGLSASSFPVDGKRNFFLIVVGPHAQVRTFIDHFSEGLPSPQVFVIDAHPYQGLLKQEPAYKATSLPPTNNLIKGVASPEFRLSSDPSHNNAELACHWERAMGARPVAPQLRTVPNLELYADKKWTTPKAGNKGLHVPEAVQMDPSGKVDLKIGFNQAGLATDQVYKATVTLMIDPAPITLPEWIKEWDMDVITATTEEHPPSRLPASGKNKNKGGSGPLSKETAEAREAVTQERGKTCNLRRFCSALAETISEKDPVKAGEFSFLFTMPK